MPKNSITWRDVLDNKGHHITGTNVRELRSVDLMIATSIQCGYMYFTWNDVVYKIDGSNTGFIVFNGEITEVDSSTLWPTNINRYDDA